MIFDEVGNPAILEGQGWPLISSHLLTDNEPKKRPI